MKRFDFAAAFAPRRSGSWIWFEAPRIRLRTLTEPELEPAAYDRYGMLRSAFDGRVVVASPVPYVAE